MVGETRRRYRCKQNNNQILLDCVDGWLDELLIGNEDSDGGGWVVVGIADLREALSKVGYELKRRPSPSGKVHYAEDRLPFRIEKNGERIY